MTSLLNHTDSELVILLHQDQKEAFDEIYRRYWHPLFRDARKRLVESEYAEEIVQDVFVDLWVNRAKKDIDQLYAYLSTAVRYQVFMLYKRHQKLPSFEAPMEYMGISDDITNSQFFFNELVEGIEDWLKLQPEKRREIFRLRYIEQRTTKEIAEELSITQKTVQNQLINGQESLRTAISKLLTVAPIILGSLH